MANPASTRATWSRGPRAAGNCCASPQWPRTRARTCCSLRWPPSRTCRGGASASGHSAGSRRSSTACGNRPSAGLADRVCFSGLKTGKDLADAYATADVLVLPSHAETYGMVVTEALARGLPVITTAVGGLPEALGRTPARPSAGPAGAAGDRRALAAALRRWLTETELRQALRAAARERRSTLSGWDVTTDRVPRSSPWLHHDADFSLFAHRAGKPPRSSSLAEEERLRSSSSPRRPRYPTLTARRAWGVARGLAGAAIVAVVVWRLGTGPFLDGFRAVNGRSLTLAAGIGFVTTVCAAWRWRLVACGLGVAVPLGAATAAYYRSQLLNTVIPGGVVGDVDRAVRHGSAVGDVGRGCGPSPGSAPRGSSFSWGSGSGAPAAPVAGAGVAPAAGGGRSRRRARSEDC